MTFTVTVSSSAIAAGPLEEGGDAAAAQLALRFRRVAPGGEAVPVGQRQALVEDLREAAAVVDLCHRVGVGHLLGPDHVAPPQRRRILAQPARRGVHQPLDDVDRLGPAGAAVGAGGSGVGHHRGEAQVDQRDIVDAGRDPGADQQLDRDADVRRVAADVGDAAHAQRQHLALRVERQLGTARDVAAVDRGQELLDPLGAPLDRALERPRRPSDGDVLGVGTGLHAEAAADVADKHPHPPGAQARQRVRDRVAHAGGHLAAQANHQPPGAFLDRGVDAARLERARRQPLVVDVDDDVVGRGCERRRRLRGIAVAHLGGDVVGRGVAQLWRAGLQRVERFGHRWQLFIVDEDRVGGGARGLARLGDDQRHGLADEAHAIVRQRAQRRRRGGAAVRAREPGRPRHRLDARGDQIGAGVHRQHAGHGAGAVDVDRFQHRMGTGRAHERGMRLPGQ